MAFVDVGDFPGEVESVLDAGVAAEAVELGEVGQSRVTFTGGRKRASSADRWEDKTSDCVC